MTSTAAALAMTARRVTAAAIACVFYTQTARAEHELVEAFDLSVEHEVFDDWKLELGGQLRFEQALSRVERALPEAELAYSANKRLSFGAGYRYIYARSGSGDFEMAHRVHLRSRFKVKWHGLRLGYRIKLQDRFEITHPGGTEHTPTLRNALELTYTAWRFADPAVSVEHFLALDALGEAPTRRWRLVSSLSHEWGPSELRAFYRVDWPRASDDAIGHMLGVGVSFQL